MEDRTDQDRHLVRSVLDGDENAFASLVAQHQKLVAGVAWRYGVGPQDIEDIVSEVFIKVYSNLQRYRPQHSLSTWIYRLAVNHVIDHGRRTRRERGRVEMPQQLGDPAADPAEDLARAERAALLQAALTDVPPRYREALFLFYVEGLKLDEAARILGVPLGTVKTRLMRGRDALRKILTRRHPEHFGA